MTTSISVCLDSEAGSNLGLSELRQLREENAKLVSV
jgi:hypothetical protein